MALIDSIEQAQQKGASPTQILQEIERQNPEKAGVIVQARSKGADDNQILAEIVRQNKPSLASRAFNVVKEPVTQPARAAQQIGTGIGSALSNAIPGSIFSKNTAERLGFTPDVAKRTQSALYGNVQPTQSFKQGVGQATQAISNLTLPFQVNPLALGLGTAGIFAGQDLEKGKSVPGSLLSGALGFGLGTGLGYGGRFVGKPIAEGLRPVYQKTMKSLSEFLAPRVANVSKPVMSWATSNAEKVVPKLETYIAASEKQAPEEAEAILRKQLLDTGKNLVNKAETTIEQGFDRSINKLEKKFADTSGNVPAIAQKIQEKLPKFGRPVTPDESQALQAVLQTLQSPREYSLKGMRVLSSELWNLVKRTEEGSPARRAATEGWAQVRKEMSKMTNGEIDPAFAKYADFKKKMLNIKPLWSEKVTEDTARNFVSSLENASKGAALDTIKFLENITKKNVPKVTDELKAKNVAKKLSAELPVAGGTISRYTSPAALGALGGAAGAGIGSIFGGGAAMAGAGLGTALGSSVLPSIVSPRNLATKALQTIEQPVISGARKTIGNILQNPYLANTATRSLSDLLFRK